MLVQQDGSIIPYAGEDGLFLVERNTSIVVLGTRPAASPRQPGPGSVLHSITGWQESWENPARSGEPVVDTSVHSTDTLGSFYTCLHPHNSHFICCYGVYCGG